MERVYYSGNTVTLTCQFNNIDGQKVDPELVKIIFYNHRYEKVNEFVVAKDQSNEVGYYEYSYQTPNITGKQRYMYEWYGEIDGKMAIKRDQFMTKFI